MDNHRRSAGLENARQQIAGSLAALAGEVQELVDVRAWVQKEPLLFAGAAALVGFLLAQKRGAVAGILSRLLPMAAMAGLKPMIERLGHELGGVVADKVHARIA
jgi:hypothetical protein